MAKSSYFLLLFCGTIYLSATAIQILIQNHFGSQLYLLPSFLPWLAVAFATSLLWLTGLLTYHFIAGHKLAFTSGTIHLISIVARYCILYSVFSDGDYTNLYFPSYFLALSTWIIYGICLIFSVTARLRWLKIAGLYVVSITLILLLTLFLYLYAPDPASKKFVENIHNKLSWLGELAVVLLLINWGIEWQRKENHGGIVLPGITRAAILVIGPACAVMGIVVGNKLFHEKPIAKSKERTASSQDIAYAERFEARTYVDKRGNRLRYRLMKPMNYDPAKKYPLVLCLHGGAGWGTDNIKQVFGSLPAVMLSNYLVREKHPAFLVVPQITADLSWGGLPHLQAADTSVVELLKLIEAAFSIDHRRLYVAGNSLGGYGSWYFICKYPGLFAAGIPISGKGDPALATTMAEVPVWAFHGAKDINVPVSGSRLMISALRKAGGNPRYSEYPDADHHIWDRVINTPHLVDWLFEQRRKD